MDISESSRTLPVLALVGRPNVGKSTLFNRLTGTRDALVSDWPGLTRDRQYGYGRIEDRRFIVVDTGGLMPVTDDPTAGLAEGQARIAIAEADRVLFLTDARAGCTAADHAIAAYLRELGKPVTLIANKCDGLNAAAALEFHELGLGDPVAVSAEHGQGVAALMRALLEPYAAAAPMEESEAPADGAIRVAIVGRPNVGKSTLVNRLLGEERVLSSEQPGTTRDAIRVPFQRDGQDYVLIDTAGIRRRARVWEAIEKFSVIKTLQAIEQADVAIAMADAQGDIGEQDARLLGLIADRGRALVLAVNKWDGLDPSQRATVKDEIDLKLPFLDFVPLHFISAKHGSGLGELMIAVRTAAQAATRTLPTPLLNRALERAIAQHQPPLVGGRRIKLRYAHQGGRNPPMIVIHGNQTERVPAAYRRYLANQFREAFDLRSVPLVLEFKTGANPFKSGPFKGKRNELTPRQAAKRRRLRERTKR